jgi:5'-nucleotidase
MEPEEKSACPFVVSASAMLNYKYKANRFPMKILVTNDDGVLSEGLWILVQELKRIAEVTVVAPDRELSSIGTALSLRQPVRLQKVKPMVPEVEAYSIDGTPSDSVILALGKLISRVDAVVSGINHGSNLGEDVHISGTVSAALQAYLQGLPALAVSAPWGNRPSLDIAARVAAILVKKIAANSPQTRIFLNVNVPDLPLAEITGAKITRLARASHLNTVEEGNRGRQKYYWLVRQRINDIKDNGTDVWAMEQGNISITPLYTSRADKPPHHILDSLCSDLLQQLHNG